MAELNLSLRRTESKSAVDQAREQFVQLVNHLHRGGKLAYLWARYEGGGGGSSSWWLVDEEPVPTTGHEPKNLHVYYSVHPLAEAPSTNKAGERVTQDKVRGRIENIAAINCLFADFDLKDFDSAAEFKRHLAGLTPKPSVVVQSGNGVHCYWLLDQPFLLTDEAARSKAQQLQYSWVAYTKSDPGAKDLARVLRVPGTTNWKPNCGKRSHFLRFDMNTLYTLEQLTGYLPELLTEKPTQLREFKQMTSEEIAAELPKVKIALSLLKSRRADDRDTWIEVGMTLAQLGDTGFELWDEWSKQSAKYDEDDVAAKWRSFSEPQDVAGRKPVTLGTLYHHAREDAANTDDDDMAVFDRLIDICANAGNSVGQQREAAAELFSRLEWYPEDVFDIVRRRAKIRRWPKAEFDRAYEQYQKNKGQSAQELSDEVISLQLAQAWLKMYPNTAWVDPEWYRFNQGIWEVHPENRIHREMAEYALSIGVAPQPMHIRNAVFFACAYTENQWGPDEWNPNPEILVVENGALDISVYPPKLLKWSPEYKNLIKMPVRYDPTAKTKYYQKVLVENLRVAGMPNEGKKVARFLMQFAGVALAEDARYEISPWLHGTAGGGKSTLLAGISAVFGDYAGNVHLGRLDNYAHGLASIVNRKLIYAFESDAKFLTNPGVLNAIISHEPVAINPKNRPEFNYTPRCSVVFAMNELPGAANPQSGIFRRVKVVNVPPRPTEQRDPRVRDIIEHDPDERSGILNLILAGLNEVRQNGGLMIPDSVLSETEAWHLDNDQLGLFIAKRCVVDPNVEEMAASLYAEFKRFLRRHGAKIWGQNLFGRRMTARGFGRRKSHGTHLYQGLRLKTEDELKLESDEEPDELSLGDDFSISLER